MVVIGLGVTGAGVALDAVTRGLSVLAVDAHDLAFGTSRWSSKLVHGGLRYLASGQVGIAHESAVERGILMEVTAPHLTHAMPIVLPLDSSVTRPRAALSPGRAARRRRAAPARPAPTRETLPRRAGSRAPRCCGWRRRCAPAGLRGGLLSWDGQLEDDARLVTTIARTAAEYGAHVRTRARVLSATGTVVELRDELTGDTAPVRARTVINAAGVWAGDLVDEVNLRPSRGTHLVLRADSLPGLTVSVFAPIPGASNRFVLVLPQPDGTIYVGLTDEPVSGEIPDVPEPTEPEIGFLLDVVSAAFSAPAAPLRRGRRVRRPPAAARHRRGRDRRPVPQARRAHQPHRGGHDRGRQADDVPPDGRGRRRRRRRPRRPHRRPPAAPARCRCSAPPRARCSPPRRRRPGWSAASAPTPTSSSTTPARSPGSPTTSCSRPIADGIPVTLAELVFGVTHEGAADVDDLLDRRTRVGLVPADRARAVPAAERALALASIRESFAESTPSWAKNSK